MLGNTSKISNTGYGTVIRFYTWEGLSATQIIKKLANVQGYSAPPHRSVAKWVAKLKDTTRDFEDAPRSGRRATAMMDESI